MVCRSRLVFPMALPMPDEVCVALFGLGTVGTGVAKLLQENVRQNAQRAGRILRLGPVVVRDLHKPRSIQLPEGQVSDDPQRILDDPRVSVVAHLMGGIEPARTILLKILESGKDVVTANKALLAEHGAELFQRARELGRTIALEASVAGGVPIVANLNQTLTANRILSLRGILNGTCNFILGAMEENETPWAEAVAQAQQLGYAEADPELDVNGSDAAQKLSILSQLAFGRSPRWAQIRRRGIERLQIVDFACARLLGFHIKLIATAGDAAAGPALSVAPMMVSSAHSLAAVRSNFNAIEVEGDAVGPLFFQGQGAGQMPTASAVVADLIDLVSGRAAITFRNLPAWQYNEGAETGSESDQSAQAHYLRFQLDPLHPAIDSILATLGKAGVPVSAARVMETLRDGDGSVPGIVLTGPCRESLLDQGLERVAGESREARLGENLMILDGRKPVL